MTRRVRRLPAILLRRWQAEEIAKTPFPCVSHIWAGHVAQMHQRWKCVGAIYALFAALKSGQVNCAVFGIELRGHPHQIRKRIRLHLLHDLPAMGLYCDFADPQFSSDLLV